MADNPLSDGLKLSMLIEPVSTRPPRSTVSETQQELPSSRRSSSRTATWAETAEHGPRLLTEARFRSDLIDFMVIVPAVLLLLFGLPFLAAASDRESHGGAYAAIGTFILMIPLGIPIAAMLYAGISYGIFGTTFGKRKQALRVISRNGTAASRKRKFFRPFIKWGVFTTTFLTLSMAAALLQPEDWRERAKFNLSDALYMIALFGTIPGILIFIVADRILPVVTQDRRSLTDILTRTRVTQNRADS